MLTRLVPSKPISGEEARLLFAFLKDYSHLLLAVSGGADSLAMMAMVAAWSKGEHGVCPRISIATVDHGLRAESADEVHYLAQIAGQLGLSHTVLRWDGEKPISGLQEAAREARYHLLAGHARTIGAEAVVLAHHAHDQAETVLMRLCAGSGITGLGGMDVKAQWRDCVLLRPFLDIAGHRLRATLEGFGLKPVEDPSNLNTRFARVRFRQAMSQLEAEGLDTVRLGRLAHRMRRADEALVEMAERARRASQLPSDQGRRFAAALWEEPDEIILRVLMRCITDMQLGSAIELFRLEELVKTFRNARMTGSTARRTLAGALISMAGDGSISVQLEGPRRPVSTA